MQAIVVGTAFGGRVHVPALRAAGIEVVALVGRDTARTAARAQQLGVPHGVTDLAAAVELVTGPFVVTVSTPPDSHVEPVLAALAAGAHVLCEKPFALSASDAERMVLAAQEAGTVALVGCEFRWATDEALAGRLIREGAIGTPQIATFVQHSGLVANGLPETFNGDWWLDTKRGGGILNAAGVHVIDRFRSWFGDVDAVSGQLGHLAPITRAKAEDTYTASLRFASGCLATMQHCAGSQGPGLRLCRVVGDAGTLRLEDGGVRLADASSDRDVDVPADLLLPPPPRASGDPREVFTWLELPAYTRLAARLRDLIEERPIDPAAPATPTFADALASQRVVDAIRASSTQSGAWIDLRESA
ncbi:MAG TPA: Gfo/Idh/MocA family oxidoreductase [Frankiaceae bacterium]|jgi:predicted dehydrogenase|nr:Gfo/Idh/MocA family oxidoreductase [Frankiaceae bacterium]